MKPAREILPPAPASFTPPRASRNRAQPRAPAASRSRGFLGERQGLNTKCRRSRQPRGHWSITDTPPARVQTAPWTFASSASPGNRRAVATLRGPGRVRACGAEESTPWEHRSLRGRPGSRAVRSPLLLPAGQGLAHSATSRSLSPDARARPTARGESGQEARQWAWAERCRRGLSCGPMGVGGALGAGTVPTPANERGWSTRGRGLSEHRPIGGGGARGGGAGAGGGGGSRLQTEPGGRGRSAAPGDSSSRGRSGRAGSAPMGSAGRWRAARPRLLRAGPGWAQRTAAPRCVAGGAGGASADAGLGDRTCPAVPNLRAAPPGLPLLCTRRLTSSPVSYPAAPAHSFQPGRGTQRINFGSSSREREPRTTWRHPSGRRLSSLTGFGDINSAPANASTGEPTASVFSGIGARRYLILVQTDLRRFGFRLELTWSG